MRLAASRIDLTWGAKVEALPKMDDLNVEGRKVFVRVDMNVPVEKGDGPEPVIMDATKIEQASATLRELLERGAAVVVGTHQGRPGSPDFISTEAHARILSQVLEMDVQWADSVVGSAARERIMNLKPGELLVLENLRFHSEENLEDDPGKLARTHMVRRLAPLFDAYVNDAFQAAHRSQPSLVAFPLLLPSAAGRLLTTMLRELAEIHKVQGRRVFALGGAKLEDKIRVLDASLRSGLVDLVLTGGLLGVLMAEAAGNRIPSSAASYKRKEILLPAAKRLLTEFQDKILYPVDFVVWDPNTDEVSHAPVYNVPEGRVIVDVGSGTTEIYADAVANSDIVVANGPFGMFEDPRFRKGTLDFVKSCSKAKREVVFCGGHLSVAAKMVGLEEGRIYTAGGAILYALSGLPLPAVDVLLGRR